MNPADTHRLAGPERHGIGFVWSWLDLDRVGLGTGHNGENRRGGRTGAFGQSQRIRAADGTVDWYI